VPNALKKSKVVSVSETEALAVIRKLIVSKHRLAADAIASWYGFASAQKMIDRSGHHG